MDRPDKVFSIMHSATKYCLRLGKRLFHEKYVFKHVQERFDICLWHYSSKIISYVLVLSTMVYAKAIHNRRNGFEGHKIIDGTIKANHEWKEQLSDNHDFV